MRLHFYDSTHDHSRTRDLFSFLWIADILAKSLFISPPLGYIIGGRVMYRERRRPLRDTLVGDGYLPGPVTPEMSKSRPSRPL